MAYKKKEDQLKGQRRSYAKNREKRIKDTYERKLMLKSWLCDIKDRMSCARCNEDDTICLDFHHTGKKF